MFLRGLTRRATRNFSSNVRYTRATRSTMTLFGTQQKRNSETLKKSFSTNMDHGIRMAVLKGMDHTFGSERLLQCAVRRDDREWVEVTWADGLRTQYPYLWLRDNCTCDQCFNAASLARKYLLNELDENIKPVNVKITLDDSSLEIEWPCGHISTYPARWLDGRSFTEENRTSRKYWLPLPHKLWSNTLQDKIPIFEFDQLIEDDKTLYDWIGTLQSDGIALLVNAPGRMGQIHCVGERVAHMRKTNYGESFQVESKENPSSLAYTPSTLGMHTDQSYYQNSLGMQMLHCIKQVPSEGGENVFADGFNAANVLKERRRDLFDILTKTNVAHLDIGSDYIDFFQLSHYPIIGLDADGNVNHINLSHGSRDSYQALPVDVITPLYKAIIAFTKILYEPENHITYKLKQGDIVCLHNFRVLHGRKSYKVIGDGTRHLEGGYIDWDELNSRRRIIARQLDLPHHHT